MEAMINRLNQLWCEIMHDAPMWPIHGRYECRTCGRHYQVDWAAEELSKNSAVLATFSLAGASK